MSNFRYYNYAQFDSGSGEKAEKVNDDIFEQSRVCVNKQRMGDSRVWGIRVFIPKLAERCVHTVNPQYFSDDHSETSIMVACREHLPENGTTFAAINIDIYTVGAMAIFEIRRANMFCTVDMQKRVQMLADLEENNPELVTIATAVKDDNISLNDRVAMAKNWIIEGGEPSVHSRYAHAMVKELQSPTPK